MSARIPSLSPHIRRLYLVRHGEVIPPGGVHGVHYGDMDVPLSDLGKLEAKAAAQFLSKEEMKGVWSSPLSRAVYGAERIRDDRSGLMGEPLTYPGFSELARGAWRGKTKLDIGPDLYDAFNRAEPGTTPEGGESLDDIRSRVLSSRDTILDLLNDGESGCVVSHLWVTRSFISDAIGKKAGDMHEIEIPTASVSIVDYEKTDGGWKQKVVMMGEKPEAGLEKGQDLGN
eukprot:CAMPEP_0118647922 /NCGR_PEP_ID=MMETSP0785-20121206/8871_1 /TAXON_ID=91992 /ORGANISM="Bolidomonas pacifica, Strain CCMP 1866" /LENGTH=228 /DNA_ID=CAMNT_0006540061 /DNA_START=102 /DNA_END=788 /DNA_ORIENTATION=-